MLLAAASLALLVVYAGIKLHIQTAKETLGTLYRCASWFFIISGFVILACAGVCCIAKCCKYGQKMMHKDQKMMKWPHHKHGIMEMEEDDDRMKYHYRKHANSCYHHDNCGVQEMNKCCTIRENACRTDSAQKK